MGCRSNGLWELWVVGVMGRRNRDLTPFTAIMSSADQRNNPGLGSSYLGQ